MLVMIVLVHASDKPMKKVRNQCITYLTSLLPARSKWPTIEKEAYAIFYALQKLDQYLHESEFVIRTDHKPLKYIMESPHSEQKNSTLDNKSLGL